MLNYFYLLPGIKYHRAKKLKFQTSREKHIYITTCTFCSIPVNIQDQVGQCSEQTDLVGDVPAHCRGVGLDDL